MLTRVCSAEPLLELHSAQLASASAHTHVQVYPYGPAATLSHGRQTEPV